VPVDLNRRRDIGNILDDAFALYRAHWMTLLACTACIVIPVQLLVFGVGLGWLTAGYDSTPPFGDNLAGAAAQLFVVTPLVTAMTVHVVQRSADRPGFRATLSAAFEVFAALLGPIALVTLGVGAGIFLLIIPGIFLAVRWCVVPQAVVVDGARNADALRRSNALVTGRGWQAFGLLVVANVLVGIGSLIFNLPLSAASKSADAQWLQLVGQALGQIVTLPLLTLAVTLLYFSLRAEKEGATRSAPPPSEPPPVRWEPPV